MIRRIQKKEYDAILRERKTRGQFMTNRCLLFKGENGWYYKQDDVSMRGAKEVAEYKKALKLQAMKQITLL